MSDLSKEFIDALAALLEQHKIGQNADFLTEHQHTIVERYCTLGRKVQHERFHFEFAADCFCDKEKLQKPFWAYDAAVIEFIEEAVHEKLARWLAENVPTTQTAEVPHA